MEERIRNGEVTVNGKVATIGDRVTPDDRVKVGDKILRWAQEKQLPRVLIYHKPEGEIVSNDDPQGRPTVFAKLPPARGAAVIELPDLGDEAKNRKLHGLVSAFVRDIARLIEDDREKGKRR